MREPEETARSGEGVFETRHTGVTGITGAVPVLRRFDVAAEHKRAGETPALLCSEGLCLEGF